MRHLDFLPAHGNRRAAFKNRAGLPNLTLVESGESSGYDMISVGGRPFTAILGRPIMLAGDRTDRSVEATAPISSPRFRRYLARRARQLAIAVLILAAALAVVACGVMLRRATSLIGLPDVGDPFDVAAFRAVRVPENLDAFVPLRQGAAKLSRMPSLLSAVIRLGPGVGWSQADPKLREWALANRAALIAFRQGAERVDGIAHADVDRIWASYLNLGPFVWLAILEASRLEEEGDMAGAWGWYRAVLQMKAHLMQRGTLMERFAFDRSCSTLPSTIATWAADRRTDPASIRKALDDACALEPKPEWETLSLKLDYLQMMNELDRQDGWVAQGSAEDWRVPFLDETLPPDLVHTAHAARRFLLNEPDRSRRVLRLAFANWLAHIQETNVRNRRPVVHAIPFIENRNAHLFFYAVSADAPAGARRVSPQDLASWLMTARDAKLLLHHWPWPALRTSGLRQHHDLVVLLAEELYHRERGKLPPSEAALVGPYLDHLPSDGSDEVDDGTAQRVDDSAISVLGQPE